MDSEHKDLLELRGRVLALEAFLKTEKYSIDRNQVRAMLGLPIPPEEPKNEE